MGSKRLFVAICLIVAAVTGAVAMTDAETEARADQIRLDEEFLFSEMYFSVKADVDQMLIEEQVLADLAITVNSLRVPEGRKALTKEQLFPLTELITYNVGNRRCVFLYVPAEKAVTFVPSAVENVAETGNVDGLVVSPSGGESQEEAQTAVTVVPGGVAQSQSEEQAEAMPAVALSPQAAEVLAAISARSGLMLGELGKLLLHYRTEEKIEDFGQVRPGTEIPSGTSLVIVDRSLRVTAILAPYSDGTIRDFRTGSVENPSSYHNCGIVWFK